MKLTKITRENEDRVKIEIPEIGYVILTHTTPEYEFSEDISEEEMEELGLDSQDFIGKIEHLYINPKSRGEGNAKLLMQKVIQYAEKKGMTPIYLNASPIQAERGLGLDDLTKFYEKFGFETFKKQGQNNLMIRINETIIDEVSMMKLTKILKEVLSELNVPKPEGAYKFYKITKKDLGYGTMHTYVYENVNGDLMEISNLVTKHPKEPGKSIYLAFKKYEGPGSEEEDYDNEEEEERKYSEKTGAADLIKVLATVVQATKNTMNKEGGENNIYAIKFSPSDNKRANIYLHYIKTLFPDFKEEKGVESKFATFVNKNFKAKE